jgi:hypothetical protein
MFLQEFDVVAINLLEFSNATQVPLTELLAVGKFLAFELLRSKEEGIGVLRIVPHLIVEYVDVELNVVAGVKGRGNDGLLERNDRHLGLERNGLGKY